MNIEPPRAPREEYTHEWFGRLRSDPYHWLHNRTDPRMMEYIRAENQYVAQVLVTSSALQKELYEELRQRIPEDDTSAPIKIDDYWYYARTVAGQEYPLYCWRRGSLTAPEEVIFNQNELATQYEYFDCIIFAVCPNHRYAAYSIDVTGNERGTLFVKDLVSGELLTDTITDVGASLEWTADGQAFYYVTKNASERPATVYRHTLGTPVTTDELIWHEADEQFFVAVSKSKDKQYIFITSGSIETSEQWYVSSQARTVTPVCITARRFGHQYYAEHHDGYFYILTNDAALDFRVVRTAVGATGQDSWESILPAESGVVRESIEVFRDYLCVSELRSGIPVVQVLSRVGTVGATITMPEVTYTLHSTHHPDYSGNVLRLRHSSPVTPPQVIDVDLATGAQTIVKTLAVRDFIPDNYVVTRTFATAADGTRIPITIAHHCKVALDGNAPCLLEGYGAYGVVEEASFRSSLVSLIDRGWICAIAHVRGGGEGGRAWYDAGKHLQKQNSFTDFASVAEHLIATQYTSATRLVAVGGSAGGLLVGAVVNQRPELFQAVVAEAPFVDCLNTMCDDALPLTPIEYDEWGDPHDLSVYDYIASYAPYENLEAQVYPHLLVRAGMTDTRVPYWEPVKWVAKLRELKTDNNLLLLKTDLQQGHSGASGRYQAWRERAETLAFMMQAVETEREW